MIMTTTSRPFNIKMPSNQWRKYHCGDKTVLWPSYLHNGISFTSSMVASPALGKPNILILLYGFITYWQEGRNTSPDHNERDECFMEYSVWPLISIDLSMGNPSCDKLFWRKICISIFMCLVWFVEQTASEIYNYLDIQTHLEFDRDTIFMVIFSWNPWWHLQMETYSALLALCSGNSLVTSEFAAQRPVTQSFDVFFDLCLNKWLSDLSRCQWFETPSCSLWRHCTVMKCED